MGNIESTVNENIFDSLDRKTADSEVPGVEMQDLS
jgi:hypothetical protein